jgi:hypothetical protein
MIQKNTKLLAGLDQLCQMGMDEIEEANLNLQLV